MKRLNCQKNKQRMQSVNVALLGLALLVGNIASAKEPDWTLYNRILHDYVKPANKHDIALNWVDYSQLKNDPDFAIVVGELGGFPVSSLTTEDEKLAFYINAYNILAIKTIIDHWPVESIKDVGSFIYPVWYHQVGKVDGNTISLNVIEHEILRQMGEPRIHFAIVCASISCPDLRTEAYTAPKLRAQLDDQVQRFLHNQAKGLRVVAGDAHVSQIFDWFDDDFKKQGGIETFLRHYVSLPATVSIKIDIPYNWSVNGE
jgi:uncharacterized protein DUF547